MRNPNKITWVKDPIRNMLEAKLEKGKKCGCYKASFTCSSSFTCSNGFTVSG